MRRLHGVALLLLAACATPQRWDGGTVVNPHLIARQLSPELLADEDLPLQVPHIPAPVALRPCCAFGSGLAVSVGGIALPGVELANTIGLADLGLHNYDNGALALEASRPGAAPITDEGNGLVYTCRGGFVDTAHVRDWADMTLFLYTRIARMLETGGVIELPDEGGRRRVVLRATPARAIAGRGHKRLALPLAQWLAFQLSVWHEIATWYGWSALEMFSEQASAFSPEDLYSNLLGIKLAGVLIEDNAAGTEVAYNEGMNVLLVQVLLRYGAVPGETAREAALAVDGRWWDSTVALPEPNLVMRRNFDTGPRLTPWLVSRATPPRAVPPGLVERCGGDPQPIDLRLPRAIGGTPFPRRATVEIVVDERLAPNLDLPGGRRILTQADFPDRIATIRAQAERRFGPRYDRP